MHDFAGLLGFSRLTDDIESELAHVFALMRATPCVVTGLTRQRVAAELKRCAKKLRREQITGRPDSRVRRLLADPSFGLGTETFLGLVPLTAAPTSELLAAVEAHRLELGRLPRVSPQRQALESAAGAALCLFLACAADSVRNEPGAWWRFVLAALDATGFPTVKLYEHPESLRPLLDKLRAEATGVFVPLRSVTTQR
jgi:hypothetical protein